MKKLDQLHITSQVADGLLDLHNMPVEDRPSISHMDIASDWYLYLNGRYKLNDFNHASLLHWGNVMHELCEFYYGQNWMKVSCGLC